MANNVNISFLKVVTSKQRLQPSEKFTIQVWADNFRAEPKNERFAFKLKDMRIKP